MPFASGGSGGSMPKATYVENIAERNALLLREGLEVVVIDAIADPNVNAHVAARYRYVNSTWKLLAKYSDLTIVQDYLALINKPNSVPASIDDAVSKRHSHTNKDVLDNTTAPFTTSEKTKLAGIESEANKYTHPSSHSADMIDETTNKQFISFTLKQFLSLLGESDSKLTFRGSIVDSGTGGGGDGSYVHPSSHSADMIDESTTRKWLSTDQQTLLNNLNDVDGKLTYKGLAVSSFKETAFLMCTAGENLLKYDPVYMSIDGKIYKIKNTDNFSAFRFVGITVENANANNQILVAIAGLVENSGWNFDVNVPVWAGNEQLTQTEPTTGFALIIGMPMGTTKLFVNRQFPIFK